MATDSPNPQESEPGCLEGFDAEKLNDVLARCDSRVKAQPADVGPLNDRALVLSLSGQHDKACADVKKAMGLLRGQSQVPAPNNDPMLLHELQVRQATCRQRLTMEGKD